jgi:hypothetical protein
VTLYREQWAELLAMADEIRDLIEQNESSLKASVAAPPARKC